MEFWYLQKWLIAVTIVKIVKQPWQYLKMVCHKNHGKTKLICGY